MNQLSLSPHRAAQAYSRAQDYALLDTAQSYSWLYCMCSGDRKRDEVLIAGGAVILTLMDDRGKKEAFSLIFSRQPLPTVLCWWHYITPLSSLSGNTNRASFATDSGVAAR